MGKHPAACLTQSDGTHRLPGCITWSGFRPYKGWCNLYHPLLECYSYNTLRPPFEVQHTLAPSLHPSHRTEPCHPRRWFAPSRTPGSLTMVMFGFPRIPSFEMRAAFSSSKWWAKINKFKLSKITGISPCLQTLWGVPASGGGNIPEMGWKRSEHQKRCGVTAFSDKRACWFLSAVSNVPDFLPSASQFLYHFCFSCTQKKEGFMLALSLPWPACKTSCGSSLLAW